MWTGSHSYTKVARKGLILYGTLVKAANTFELLTKDL